MALTRRLPTQVLEQIQGARNRLARAKVLVGFDGFVDSILHVVKTRESATKYSRVERMAEFGETIVAAAGLSANMEMVTQMVKLGGNGPIMAHALGAYGTPVTYIGNLGPPVVHPVFADLGEARDVHSIAEPGYTDAIEFDDGKLMFGKHESLKDVNWANLISHVPEATLIQIFTDSTLIAMVNWTMLTQMTAIWQKILTRIAPVLAGRQALALHRSRRSGEAFARGHRGRAEAGHEVPAVLPSRLGNEPAGEPAGGRCAGDQAAGRDL